MFKNLLILLFLATLIFNACSGNNDEVSEEELGLRKTDLYSENDTLGQMAQLVKTAAGQSENIERSFENAPPLIPHTVEGFLPIKAKSNTCLACHLPELAEAAKATSVPVSHLMNFRPDMIEKDGKYFVNADEANNEVIEVKLEKLSFTRYNCSQCHVAQADITVLVDNTFIAEFRNEEMKKKSNFGDNVKEGMN